MAQIIKRKDKTMNKTATTLEQSRKLAEFLPIESADMQWIKTSDDDYPDAYRMGVLANPELIEEDDIPSWSLSALLGALNKNFYPDLFHDGESWNIKLTHHDYDYSWSKSNSDPIDAVCELIELLNDKKLI